MKCLELKEMKRGEEEVPGLNKECFVFALVGVYGG